jgi:protoporphyrinogen oxidase
MGLAAAWALAREGVRVTVYERDDRIGGMSAHVDFAGTRIERYYHFVCAPDAWTVRYLEAFGLGDALRWRDTHMGCYWNGQLHDWGNPLALLRFPGLTLAEKVRYALHVLHAKGTTDWTALDRISSTEWLHRWIGPRAYDVLWRPLFHHKFYEHEDRLSAAWLGTRIQRVAKSRRSLFQERLGYIEGGSEALLERIAARIVERGGRIALAAGVQAVLAGRGRPAVRAIRVDGEERPVDLVVSTIPLPYLARLVPDLPAGERARIEAIESVGVVCVLLKLKHAFTRNFWTNVLDPRLQIPGLIEYTNLNPLDGSHVLYAPYYMPRTHPKYRRDPAAFIEETLGYLQLIRPDFDRGDALAATASRYDHAQAVCTPGFFAKLPPMASALDGLFLADTSHYYPEDRSISESLRVGERLAALALARAAAVQPQRAAA